MPVIIQSNSRVCISAMKFGIYLSHSTAWLPNIRKVDSTNRLVIDFFILMGQLLQLATLPNDQKANNVVARK